MIRPRSSAYLLAALTLVLVILIAPPLIAEVLR